MDRVVFDHNMSIGDDSVYRFASSTSTTAFENTVVSARIGMRPVGANEHLKIIDNDLEVRQVGLARHSNPPVPSNFGVLIQGNNITSAPRNDPLPPPRTGIGMGAGGLKNSWILDNVTSGLDGEGIALLAGNTDNVVRGNIVTNNGSNGIRAAAGATGNTFEANEILGNGWRIAGTVDAQDDARESNEWHANACLTDFPAGTICGIGYASHSRGGAAPAPPPPHSPSTGLPRSRPSLFASRTDNPRVQLASALTVRACPRVP